MTDRAIVLDAARSWLALLQADETIIEKMAKVIANLHTEPVTPRDKACVVLAAITGKDE